VTPHAHNSASAQDQAQRLAALGRVPREVFALLADSTTPLKAYELLWRLQANRGRRAPPTTIYRALATLIEAGLVHRIESLGAFIVCAMPDTSHDPIFLLCEQCGSALETNVGSIAQSVTEHVEGVGFQVRRLNCIVRGRCSICRAACET
jgi:Fur family zinc uptake transcriptional regulator